MSSKIYVGNLPSGKIGNEIEHQGRDHNVDVRIWQGNRRRTAGKDADRSGKALPRHRQESLRRIDAGQRAAQPAL